jgi:hypothetical protein
MMQPLVMPVCVPSPEALSVELLAKVPKSYDDLLALEDFDPPW